MGVAGGPGSIDGRVVASPGGGIQWVDDDHVILQTTIGGAWTVVLVDTRNGELTVPAPARGANQLVAGGGRWAAFLASSPSFVYGALGELSGASLYAAGPDGTIAWKRVYQASAGLTLTTPNGAVVDVLDALPLDVQVIGPGQAVWQDLRGLRAIGVPLPKPAAAPGRLRRVDLNGEIWLVYYADGIGIVAQVDGSSDGYILETRPIAFNHDAVAADGELVVAWSLTQGEAPGDLVKHTVDRGRPRVAITRPVPFAFTHPVIVAPFKAEGSGLPDLFSFGEYSEETNPLTVPTDTRLLLAHDGETDWLPPEFLQPFDVPMLECYLTGSETVSQSAARWLRQMHALLAAWPGDVGVIPMFYCQGGIPSGNPPERWPIETVLEGLSYFGAVVNLSPRVKLIAPFAYNRANGIVAHPELQQAFAALVAASRTAGAATLLPIVSPTSAPHPPTPKPQPAPAPTPIPSTPFPPARPAGGSMRVFLKLNGKYTGISPTPAPGHSGDAAYPVYHDRDAGNGWEAVELERQPDGRFRATYVEANRVLSIQPDGSLQSREAGTYGGYEQLAATSQPDPDAVNLLYRVDDGKVLGTPLTIDEAA